MKKSTPLFFAFLMAFGGLWACGGSGTLREGGFQGLGQGHVTATEGVVQGEVLHKSYQGGTIVVEARSTFPCPYGRCPVIEKDPLGQEVLDGPGPFNLSMTEIEENIIIIASYESPNGSLRVSHQLLVQPEKVNDGIQLSLDRPYPPLR
ncbi:MAG: hypothetical protein R3257_05265 [bacterium]|nr:hypothetical protein [bacterium]